MTTEPDLFPGFGTRLIKTQRGGVFVRIGGNGAPILLLHGYPETHHCWHAVAPALARHFTVVVADLPGYGASEMPPTDADHRPYSKRAMASALASAMEQLGFGTFTVIGHDRGARVAYRMALDRPEQVEKLVVIDILTTIDQWKALEPPANHRLAHWPLLAQPAPLPESLIGNDPIGWLEGRLKRGALAQSLAPFSPAVLDAYRRAICNSDRVNAMCEDYRAGARCDLADDTDDRAAGRLITCPVLVVWGSAGSLASVHNRHSLWQAWCTSSTEVTVESGHFVPEENPAGLLAVLQPFLGQPPSGAQP